MRQKNRTWSLEPLEPRLLLSATASTPHISLPTTPASRQDISLDSSWEFLRADATGAATPSFNDSTWTPTTLPHTWNALDGEDGGNNYYRGIGWYRRHYTVPAADIGQRMFLQFDGADSYAEVYVNGTLLGTHSGGYTTFVLDAT